MDKDTDVFAYRTIGVKAAARELSCSDGQIYNMVHRGELESIRLGRRVLIKTDSLRRLLDADA